MRPHAAPALLVVALAVAPPAGAAGPVLRLAAPPEESNGGIPTLDPQADGSYNGWSFSLLRATCTTLVEFPDRSGRRADIPVPAGATGFPLISRDGKTYTFTIRRGLRFSDGTPVTAAHYARAIQRLRDPAMHGPSVAGAPTGIDVYASDFARYGARGSTLRITLKEPAGDLLARLALPMFCPVPTDFPSAPEGIPLTVGSGPYRLVSQVPNRSILLRPNRYYHGPRERRFGAITVTLEGTPQTLFSAVEANKFDYAFTSVPRELRVGAVASYGLGKRRLFYKPSNTTLYVAFNLRSPLFRNNLPLRRAIGYAIDRPELFRIGGIGLGSRRLAQLISPGIPGFSPAANLFPLSGADFRTAGRLANGHLRSGHAVLYSLNGPVNIRQSQVIQYDLKQIGLDVEIRPMSFAVLFPRLSDPNERWDMTGVTGWVSDYPDPSNFVIPLFTHLRGAHYDATGFSNGAIDARVRAANRLQGNARVRAFASIAHDIVKNYVPIVPVGAGQGMGLVSKRLGCVTFNPETEINLLGLCLRER